MQRILIISLLFLHTALSAQKGIGTADAYFNDFKFKKAIEAYSKIASKEKRPSQYLVLRLADSYFNINDYQNARIWYEKLYKENGKNIGENTFIRYIQSLKADRDYDRANDLIATFYKENPRRLQLIAREKRALDSLSLKPPLYEVFNLRINTAKSEFGAVYYNNNVVFSSTRDTAKLSNAIYAWNDQPYLDLYIAERDASNGELYRPGKFLENLESSYHDATLAFSRDFKTVYFSRNYLKKNKLKVNNDGVSNMQILRGNIVDGKITNIVSMKFNDVSYSCSHPSLSPDGKQLFFVSDMPGGYGETDIYVVDVYEDGTIGSPVNLGAMVNTPGREMFPQMVGTMLYFASDAHFGLGGLDIFQTEIKSKGNYGVPSNLGAPINSNMDDFAYFFDPEESNGYFSSNRFSGKGDDDIYYFKKSRPENFQVRSGKVLELNTEKPIAGASVKVVDLFNKPIAEAVTDEKGFYSVELPCGTETIMFFFKPEYSKRSVEVNTMDRPCPRTGETDVYLVGYGSLVEKDGDMEKIKVNPIYFDFNKYDITPKAIIELEKVVFAMEQFPELKIKIESHTDSRGSDSYNLTLSHNRAKSTHAYLIGRGIDPQRIESAIGYGESRPKNGCSNGVKCTEEEFLLNRRSDFIIISK
ncbi:MAG TPA: OmpA family protein [Arenibacter sp.]|nr:OmpA family protein [Arenibacter sp.]